MLGLDAQIDADRCRRVFDRACQRATFWDAPPVWLHGDLHPLNLLVANGRLAAVVDFGDIFAGDPATDLAVAWMVIPAAHRPVFRYEAGTWRSIDDATWQRARAWALALAVAYLTASDDNPVMASIGRRTLAAALDDL